ncbi:MAG: PspC domain-containing protein [bacterium]
MDVKKRIFRSRDNRVIAGICGGMGEYFNVDSVVLRIVWLLLVLGFGTGVLAYLICWIVIPTEPLVIVPEDTNNE